MEKKGKTEQMKQAGETMQKAGKSMIKAIIWIVILAVVMAAIFGGCNHYAKSLDTSKVKVEDSKNGSGQVVGKYGVIKIKAETLNSFPYKDIKSFLAWTKSQQGKLDYLAIVLDDGSGFVVVGCDPMATEYGMIDSNDRLTGSAEAYLKDCGTYYTLTDENGTPLSTSKSTTGINGMPS